MSIQDYYFYKFTSLNVAAAAVLCARKALGLLEVWNEDLRRLCFISYEDIKESSDFLFGLAKDIYPLLDKFGVSNQGGIEKTPDGKRKISEQQTRSGFDGSDVKNKLKERENCFRVQEFKIEGGKEDDKENDESF